MHYTRKEDFKAGFIGDAESLMREFYRLEKEVSHLDQNNLGDAGGTAHVPPLVTGVNFDTAYSPASGDHEAITLTHNTSGDLLYKSVSAPVATAVSKDKWTDAAATVELSFSVREGAYFMILVSGAVSIRADVAGGNPLRFDVSVRANGSVLSPPATGAYGYHTANTTVVYGPYFLCIPRFLTAGDWVIKPVLRQRYGVGANMVDTNIGVIGLTR
jgi:hypothetical protein